MLYTMELLKKDLLLSWKAVKVFQKESEMWKYYDGRVRSLIELLYGSNVRAEMPKERGHSIQESQDTR